MSGEISWYEHDVFTLTTASSHYLYYQRLYWFLCNVYLTPIIFGDQNDDGDDNDEFVSSNDGDVMIFIR